MYLIRRRGGGHIYINTYMPRTHKKFRRACDAAHAIGETKSMYDVRESEVFSYRDAHYY